MKSFLAAALAAGTIAFAPAQARAEPVDMSTITCGQLAGMKQEEVGFILIWVMGYMAGLEEELSMDPDILGNTVAGTVAYCAEHTEMSVLNAATEVAGG